MEKTELGKRNWESWQGWVAIFNRWSDQSIPFKEVDTEQGL